MCSRIQRRFAMSSSKSGSLCCPSGAADSGVLEGSLGIERQVQPEARAAARIGVGDTAFPHRAEGYNFLVLSQWTDAGDNDACIAWARETYAEMQPFVASGRYVNYLDDDEAGDPIANAYGANYRRLQELKTKYDPKNFFRMNQNILPLA